MSSVINLFIYRLKTEWKFQFAVFRTAVDWTVALYMVVPALIYVIYHYLEWWKALPAWSAQLPFSLLIGLVFFFSWSGTIRIFLDEADQLFLLQCPLWLSALTRFSIIYSGVLNLLLTGILFLLLAPFLLFQFHLLPGQILTLAVFTFALKNVMSIAKQLLALRFKGWIQRIMQTTLFALTGMYFRGSISFLLNLPILFILSGFILLIALALLIGKRLNLKGAFFEDVAREQYERMKLANLLLRASGYHVKKLRTIRNRHLLFRNSNLLFKDRTPSNALVELSIKSVLRNGGHLKIYCILLVPIVGLALAVPASWGWVLLLVFALILTNFVALFWRETIHSPFVQLFPWQTEDRVTAAAKAIFLMALPGLMVACLAFGLKNYSWFETLGLLTAGVLAGYFSAKTVSLWAG